MHGGYLRLSFYFFSMASEHSSSSSFAVALSLDGVFQEMLPVLAFQICAAAKSRLPRKADAEQSKATPAPLAALKRPRRCEKQAEI